MDYTPIIKKENLVDGVYYVGRCRNASIARWNAAKEMFLHWRYKFGWFLEAIHCPEDETNFDVFIAERPIDVTKVERKIDFDDYTFWRDIEP